MISTRDAIRYTMETGYDFLQDAQEIKRLGELEAEQARRGRRIDDFSGFDDEKTANEMLEDVILRLFDVGLITDGDDPIEVLEDFTTPTVPPEEEEEDENVFKPTVDNTLLFKDESRPIESLILSLIAFGQHNNEWLLDSPVDNCFKILDKYAKEQNKKYKKR